MILAGITIVYILGENGVFKLAQEADLQVELSIIEERGNIIYANLIASRYAENDINKTVTLGNIISELKKENYQIKQIAIGENTITGIKLEKDKIKVGKNEIAKIKVIFESSEDNYEYYVKIENKYYKIDMSEGLIIVEKIGKSEEELEEGGKEELIVTTDSDIVTIGTIMKDSIEIIANNEIGEANITIRYGDLEEKICKIIVAVTPVEENADVTTEVVTNYGRIEIIWLNEKNEVVEEPNTPVLGTNGDKMIPIKWDTTTPTIVVEENKNYEWYQYIAKEGTEDNTSSQWANAQTKGGSYFVWIPRYAYRITYYESMNSNLPTGYYDGYGMWNSESGKVKLKLEDGIEIVEYNEEKYIVHPAFGTTKTDVESKEKNIDLGGWDRALTGFWFAKFEMSYNYNGNTFELESIPGKKATKNGSIDSYYHLCRNATFGQTGVKQNNEITGDEIKSFMNSHMCKNSEWGAVVYLTHSQFGRNGNKLATGTDLEYAGGVWTREQLESETDTSTTGNLSGIYDISGGHKQYVAAFNISREYNQDETDSFASYKGKSTRYATAYHNGAIGGAPIISQEMYYQILKTGEATKEVGMGYGKKQWFEQKQGVINYYYPYISRSGERKSDNGNGMFSIDTVKFYDTSSSIRSVLCAE